MENEGIEKLIDLKSPLIECIIDFLDVRNISKLNKHIKNKKIFKSTCKTRFKFEKINKIKELVCDYQFEIGFGIIVFLQLKTFNKNMIAVAGLTGGLELINIITKERSGEIRQHQDTINCIVEYKLEDKNILASSSYDHKVKFLDLNTNKDLGNDLNCDFIVYFMKIINLEQKQYLLTSTFQKYDIRCLETMKQLFSVKLHGNYIYKVIHTKCLDNEFFLTCSYDNSIKLSNYKSGAVISNIEAHKSAVWGLAYLKHYNKKWCASGSWDFFIKIWNFIDNELISEINCSPNNTKHLQQFSFLKGKFIMLSYGGKVSFYDIKKKEIIYECEPHTTDIYWFSAIKQDENNFTIVTSSIDRRLKFHHITPI